MVLLSDFLKSFNNFEEFSAFDVYPILKRLNLFYYDEDYVNEHGKVGTYVLLDFVGFTSVLLDSPEGSKFIYLFRSRCSVTSPFLYNHDVSWLLKSNRLYCRPKRAWRDWFEKVLLPY